MTDPTTPLREALTFGPDVALQPGGRIARKWWRLGFLSALAIARDRAALAARLHPLTRAAVALATVAGVAGALANVWALSQVLG